MRTAALASGVTIYTSGIEPGFAGDQFAVLLTTRSNTIRSIRAQEILRLLGVSESGPDDHRDGIRQTARLHPPVGTGKAHNNSRGGRRSDLSHALLVSILTRSPKVMSGWRRRATCTWHGGTIPAGTCGAVRAETTGVVGGHPVITIEHINRWRPDLAPGWATAPNGTYRLLIEVSRTMQCDLRLGDEDTPASANDNAMEATANASGQCPPYVVDSRSGNRHLAGLADHRAAQCCDVRLDGENGGRGVRL